MKKYIVFVLVLFLILTCKKATKQSSNKEMSAEVFQEKSEWIILFDGTNFNNWRGYLNEDMYEEWTIEDGAMAFTPGVKGGKNIISKEKYTNFILSLEWKISEGGNSGIFWDVIKPDRKYKYWIMKDIQILF
jgi:hypothetical protein